MEIPEKFKQHKDWKTLVGAFGEEKAVLKLSWREGYELGLQEAITTLKHTIDELKTELEREIE